METSNPIIEIVPCNSGIELVGEGEPAGLVEGIDVGVEVVEVADGAAVGAAEGLGEVVDVDSAKLWKTRVAGLVDPS